MPLLAVWKWFFPVFRDNSGSEVSAWNVEWMDHLRNDVVQHTVKLQIFVWYPFSYFWLETCSYELIFVLLRASKQMTVKFDGVKAKRIFHAVLNLVLFSKVRKYENKYRTKICNFTVPEHPSRQFLDQTLCEHSGGLVGRAAKWALRCNMQ